MIRVNKVEFRRYDLDTPITFSQRISAEFDTLPKYLYFPDGLDLEKKEIKVDNLLEEIKSNAKRSTNFAEFLKTIDSKLGKNLNVEKDILHIWLVYNKLIDELFQRRDDSAISKIAQELIDDGYFVKEVSFTNFWKRDREVIKKRLKDAIRFNKSIADTQEELYQKIESIAEGPVYLPLNIERVNLMIRLKLTDISLLELFNSLLLNEAVPFATSKQYYKILKDFVPPEEWSVSPDNLLLKVSDKEIVNTAKFTDYTDVILTSSENYDIFAEMRINIIRGNLARESFISRILQPFASITDGKAIEYDSAKETEIAGVFYFPQFRINPYVFSDLVMNNSLFSYLLSIDESTKATKKKSETSQPWLYVHFDHPSTGHVTAGITQKIVQRSDPVVKEADSEIFPVGSPYIRVRAKGKDLESIKKFQDLLSKLLEVYNENHNEIETFYKKFIPDFGEVEEEKIEEVDLNKPKNIAPEIFVTNYTRNCNDDRMPVIVLEKEVKNHKRSMKFPRDIPEEGISYPSDGINQQYYVCTNPKFPYPGLQHNKLIANSKDYPFVPCCFANPQDKKRLWQHYFLGKELETEKGKKQQDLIKTDKILGSEKYGILPSELESLFELLDPDPSYKYIRLGVHRNHSSFLNTVMVGLHEETDVLNMSDEKRIARLNKTRSELSSPLIAPLCRQSVYDNSISLIQKNIKNSDIYLDPNLYLQLLENYFDCNIFLFNRKRLVLPRHLQSFYTMQRETRPCLFVYEHWGSESDHAEYPQCELIVKWKLKSTDTQYGFEYTEKISRGIRQLFSLLRQSYTLDKPVENTVFSLESPLLSQRIDSYGKCRQLQADFEGKSISLFTEPIPPQRTEEITEQILNKPPINVALDFIKKEQSKLVGQIVINNTLKEVKAIKGNVLFTIPVQDTKPYENIPISIDISYPDNKESSLVLYNRNKKLARYIVEYTYWLFSRFLEKEEIKTINDEILADFAKKYITIVKDFEYLYIKKTFSRKGGVMKDKKLVVTSEEMLKRLMYTLKLYSVRDTKSLVNYKNRTVIQHYYQDITDFFQHPKQVILHGEESIEKWIQESRMSYVLHDEIVIGTRSPYFFKNELVDDKVFLAQNIESIPKALYIANVWYKQGYNVSVYAEVAPIVNFTLYSYVNSKEIQVYKTFGASKTENIRIIGYKTDNTPFYTVLLPL